MREKLKALWHKLDAVIFDVTFEIGEAIDKFMFWKRLEKAHPVIYEIIQWSILVMGALVLIFG